MESLNLTPAESLMIISPNSNGNDMIKYTLMDLIIKKALNISYREDSLKKHYNAVISKNDAFKLKLKPHEEILMKILDNHELELNVFAEALFKRVRPSNYKNEYIMPLLMDKGYFKRQRRMLLALVPYNAYILTDKGLKIKSKLIGLLNEVKYLEKWIREDLGHAKAYLSVMGSHILLTKTHNMDDIKKFNRMLSYIKPDAKSSDYYSYYVYTVPNDYLNNGDIDCVDFMDLTLIDNFDSFDNFFSDFDVEKSMKNK